MGGLREREERSRIFIGPRRGRTPGLPPHKAVPTQWVCCGLVGKAVYGGVEESGPGKGSPKIHAGARPLFLGGVFLFG